MRRDRLIAALLLGSALAAVGCDDTILDPMMNDQKYKPYEGNEFFADGRAMRDPPAGAVPRERVRGDVAFTTGRKEADDFAPYIDYFPLPVTKELVAQGRKRFEITCATCHGLLGDGDSIVAGKMSLKPPPSLHLRTEPGYFFDVITRGHGMMASYAAEIPLRERWAVVAYVRALQMSQKASAADVPAAERGRLEREAH